MEHTSEGTLSNPSSLDKKGQTNFAFKEDFSDPVTERKEVTFGQSTNAHHAMEKVLPEREKWSNQSEFLLSCVAMAVGVGNVWRFPFVALENGGGAFLIPYLFVLVFIGKPLYYMEFCMGQFASSGSVKVWEISPAFRGIGYGQALSTWMVSTFYVTLMALCVYFFFGSFNAVLPWALCDPSWASQECFDANTTVDLASNSSNLVTAAEEYFKNEVLKIDPFGFDNGLGLPDWKLSLCLLFSWFVIFVIQANGVKSSGKAAYFTALFPYLVLFIMLTRGITLPGAAKGILFFITPRWEKLMEPGVWYAAVDQAFFSLSVGFGVVMMLASYNPFRQNVYRDATIISFVDTFTCLFAGITIFAVLGHLAELLDVDVEDVVKTGGTSLAFISYPDVLARFQYVPQLFSALFFLMLFTLGVGSAIPFNGVTVTIICDRYPHIKTWKVTFVMCTVGFIVGLLYTTPQGQHVLTLVNHYAGGVSIIFLMILQLVAVMWVYGINNFIRDIDFMLNRKTGLYWKVCWGIFNPIFLTIIFVYYQVTSKPLTYGTYVFDSFTTYCGMSMAVIACLMVPIFFVVELFKRRSSTSSMWQRLKEVFQVTSNWCPRDAELQQEYQQFINSQKGCEVI